MLSREAFAALDQIVIAPTAASGTEPAAMIDALLAKKGLRRRVQMTVPHFLVTPFVVAGSDLVLTPPARLLAPFRKSPKLRAIALPLKLPRRRARAGLGGPDAQRRGAPPGPRRGRRDVPALIEVTRYRGIEASRSCMLTMHATDSQPRPIFTR